MTSHTDFPLPLSGGSGSVPNPWALPHPQPTSLIALWPGNEPPTKSEIIAALQQQAHQPMQEIQELEGGVWNGVFQTPFVERPIIVWVDPAEPLPQGELEDVPEARDCKWVVGMETILGADPYEEYVSILRALARATDGPGILDPVTRLWWLRPRLDDFISDPPADPPLEALWTIHAVNDRSGNGDGVVWLHTHGLRRCNRPELEMLEVPGAHTQGAATLMNEAAAFVLESDLPAAGARLTIGPALDVVLQPWQEVAPHVDAQSSGGTRDREGDDNPHAGVSAVLCAPMPKGRYRPLWVWPEEAVQKLAGDDAIVFRSTHHTQREALAAQERWGDLATAYAAIHRRPTDAAGAQQPVFLIKTGLAADDGDPDRREHLWFKVRRIQGDHAQAELLNQPLHIASMRPGDVVTVERASVSDWSVFLPAGRFGPHDVPALWRAIESQKGA